MEHEISPGLVVDAASGFLFIAIGIFVYFAGLDQRANRWFAVFSTAFGSALLLSNTVFLAETAVVDPPASVINGMFVALIGLFGIAAVSMIRLATVFPSPLRFKRLGIMLLPAMMAFVFWSIAFEWHGFRGPGPLRSLYMVSVLAMFASLFCVLVLLPMRHAFDPDHTAVQRRQIRLFAWGMLLYPGLMGGMGTLFLSVSLYSRLVSVAILVLVAILWLVAAVRAEPTERTMARWLAWAALAIPLVGMIVVVLVGDYQVALDSGIMGAGRAVGFVILAYGIVRYSLFDIDLKVKWTLKRSSLIAGLAAVFFIAKEGTEALLPTEGFLSSLVGAALVTIIALPAWKSAGRLADRLLPGVEDSPGYLDERRALVYRTQLEGMVVDGRVTQKERHLLHRLRETLALDQDSAALLEEEVLGAARGARALASAHEAGS